MLALILGEMIAVAQVDFIIFIGIIPLFLMFKIATGRIGFFPVVIFLMLFLGVSVMNGEQKKIQMANEINNNVVIMEGQYDTYKQTETYYWYYLNNVNLKTGNKLCHMRRVLVKTLKQPDFLVGNIVRVEGKTHLFEQTTNYGTFDSAKYYKSNGIYLYIEEENSVIIDAEYMVFRGIIQKLRIKIGNVLENICDEKNVGIFQTIILGDKSSLAEDVKQMYQNNGISHLLAVSGLHVTTMGMMIFNLFRKRCKFVVSGSMSLLVVVGFMYLSGAAVSCVRATVMFVFFLMSQMVGRKYDVQNAMSFAAIILIFDNPYVIYNSAFQMSFGAVISIGVVYPAINQFIMRMPNFKTKRMLKKSFSNKVQGMFLKGVKAFLISVSVNFTLLPIIFLNYYEIAWLGTVLNVVVIPLMSVVLGTAIVSVCLYLLVSICSVSIATVIGHVLIAPGCIVLEIYEVLCAIFSRIPFNLYVSGKPKLVAILIYYILLGTFVVCVNIVSVRRKNKEQEDSNIMRVRSVKEYKRYTVFKFVKIISFIIGLYVLCLIVSVHKDEELHIVVNDVGQGESILMYKDNFAVMVDCGSTDESDIYRYRIKTALKARGINKIDYLFVTHCDDDHISGVEEMISDNGANKIKVDNLVFSANIIEDESYLRLVGLAKDRGTNIVYMNKGDSINFKNVKIQCLFPTPTIAIENRNSMSLVLDVSYGDYDMLLTGDISSSEEELLINQNLRHYDLLKVAHHGSKYSTSNNFLEKVNPSIAIISCGKNNSYGHPHMEVLKRLVNIECFIYRTDILGQIDFVCP